MEDASEVSTSGVRWARVVGCARAWLVRLACASVLGCLGLVVLAATAAADEGVTDPLVETVAALEDAAGSSVESLDDGLLEPVVEQATGAVEEQLEPVVEQATGAVEEELEPLLAPVTETMAQVTDPTPSGTSPGPNPAPVGATDRARRDAELSAPAGAMLPGSASPRRAGTSPDPAAGSPGRPLWPSGPPPVGPAPTGSLVLLLLTATIFATVHLRSPPGWRTYAPIIATSRSHDFALSEERPG